MKTYCLIALVAVTAAIAARGASSTNTTSQLRLTDIYSDDGFYDGNAHTVIYHGNVRVIGPDMKLTCDLLTADLPESGGHINHIVAETNVVVDVKDSKGQTVHATSQKAVYDYSVKDGVTNETVTLTGSPQPQVEDAQGTQLADVITWDRSKNSFRFSGHYHLSASTADTNAPAATTNTLRQPLPDPLPGTINNIDRINNRPASSQRGF
jgi:lipopolysaccharide export system protein LptA